MKKKVLAATALLSCSTLLFTACGSPKKVEKLETFDAVYQKYEAKEYLTSGSEISTLSGYDYTGSTVGDFFKFTKTDSQTGNTISQAYLNKETGEAITLNDEDTYPASSSGVRRNWTVQPFSYYATGEYSDIGNKILVATITYTDYGNTENNYTKTYAYDKNGNTLVTTEQNYGYINVDRIGTFEKTYYTFSADNNGVETTFYFDEKGNKVDYNPESDIFDASFGSSVSEIKGENGGYIFYDTANYRITSYDSSENELYTLDLPSYAIDVTRITLDSGNYILQYKVQKEVTARRYDLLIGESKYDLTTILVNPYTQKETELKCNFVLRVSSLKTPASIKADKEVWNWTDGIEAVFKGIGEIGKDKRVDYNNANLWFGVMEDGTIKKATALVDGMEITSVMENANGDFLVIDNTGKYYAIDKEDKSIIKEINLSAVSVSALGENDNYIAIGKKIYDISFREVYTLTKGYSIEAWLEDEVIIKQTIETDVQGQPNPKIDYKWYLLNNGDLTLIADTTNNESVYVYEIRLNGNYSYQTVKVAYRVMKETNEAGSYIYSCKYYNASGEQISGIGDQQILEYLCANADGSEVYFSAVIKDAQQAVTNQSVYKLSK